MKKLLFLILGSTLISCSSNAENNASAETFLQEETNNTAVVAPQGGYVDLTDAAEQTVNAVVYIKVTQMGKTHTVTYRDPFAEFFGEMFGHRGYTPQQREYKEPDRRGAGSGVIISSDGYIVTEGAQVVLGGNDCYIAMCHRCYVRGIREHKKIKLHGQE